MGFTEEEENQVESIGKVQQVNESVSVEARNLVADSAPKTLGRVQRVL